MAQKSATAKERFSTFGRTTLKKFNKMRIYIEGLSKIGADLTTNLVLLNPQTITIFDKEVIQIADCHNTFHYPPDQVGKAFRMDSLIEICKKINKKTLVKKLDQELQPEDAQKFDLLIFCDVYDIDRVIRIDTMFRQNNVNDCGVIFAGQMGFYGYMFTDFGDAFKMMNTGKHLPVLLIDNITNQDQGKVTVNKQFKHGFKHGDFIRIDGVEGMKEVNGDARPVKIQDDYTFIIESTRNYGKYIKGGIAQKVKMTERIPFPNIKNQIIETVFKQDEHKETNELLLLATSAILSFYENNNKIPELFNEVDENQAYDNAMSINSKKINVNQSQLRSIIKTCAYGFYPMVRLMAAVVSMECVKKTGKYTPLPTPYFVNWYDRISFEIKKKITGQYYNIIETDIVEKMTKMQVGIIDDGAQSLELFNVLFSCQIAQSRKLLLFGLETLEEKQAGDPLVIKAHLKFDVSRQLFKNRKMESLPCSLSFSNDQMLMEAWKRIKLLINASQQMSEYIYDNIVYNQIDLIDCQFSDLKALMRSCVQDRSRLRGDPSDHLEQQSINMPNQYKYAVEWAVDVFKLLFIQLFQDVRCFIVCGPSYFHKVDMDYKRKKIFYLLLLNLEEGGHIQPQSIVRICKTIFTVFFQEETKQVLASHEESYWTGYHRKPILIDLADKDQLVEEFLNLTYLLISWFFCKEKPDLKTVSNAFIQYLYKVEDQQFTQEEREMFVNRKANLLSRINIPYTSLLELYKMELSVQFIWNASLLRSKIFGVEEEITKKKFFRFYNRKTRPCPFVHQILTSYVPLAIISMLKKKSDNVEVNILENLIRMYESEKPQPLQPRSGRIIPDYATQWTVIVIEGPKKIEQVLQRFLISQSVIVTSIRIEQKVIYEEKASKSGKTTPTNITIEAAFGEKRADYDMIVEGIHSKTKEPCTISKTKYVLQPNPHN